jgi:hypothetical protein
MPAERQPLESLLPACSLSAENLLDIGRAFAFLEGDQLAVCWYEAGIAKAEIQYRNTKPGEASAQTLLHLLDQTKALWRLKDYAAMEKRFALAMRLNPPLSVEARRAGYLHAEMLYYQRAFKVAAASILAVQAQHDAVGDLGALDRSDINEMHWVQGLMLCHANRYTDALPHLESVAEQRNGEHAKSAAALRISCLAQMGRIAEAEARLNEYVGAYRPERREVANFVEMIEARKSATTKR